MASIEQPPYKQDLIDRMKRMEDALRELLDCPYVLSEATIPRRGIDYAPENVVGTLHVGLVRYRKAKAALEEKPIPSAERGAPFDEYCPNPDKEDKK